MGILNRALLFVYTLFWGLVAIGVICVYLQIIPDRVLFNEYEYAVKQWQTAAVAGVVFLTSIHLLFCSLAQNKDKEVTARELLIARGEGGEVNISLAAIRSMAEGMADNIRGVRSAKAKTRVEHRKNQGDFLKLDMQLEVGQERSITDISDELRAQLQAYLTNTAGINDVEISVSVQSIVSGVSVKKRRIR